MLDANVLNSIKTPLHPISQSFLENMHWWPYSEIAKRLTDRHIIDLGGGCGLLSVYLAYHNHIDTSEIWDTRETQLNYAQDLINTLGLQNRITIKRQFATPSELQNKTIIAIRFGDLLQFEKFYFNNRLITLRRTKEVELFADRNESLPWKKEIITRQDGFELEYLEFDYFKTIEYVIGDGERWMETFKPEVVDFINKLNLVEVSGIGGDWVELV